MVYFSCNYNELTFPWLRFLTPSDISEPIKETKKRPGKQDKWRKDSSPQTPHLAISRLLGMGSPAVRNPARAGRRRVTASLWGESLAASTWAEPAFLPGGWRECRGEGLFGLFIANHDGDILGRTRRERAGSLRRGQAASLSPPWFCCGRFPAPLHRHGQQSRARRLAAVPCGKS